LHERLLEAALVPGQIAAADARSFILPARFAGASDRASEHHAMITGVNHAVLKVRDLDRSVAFYERVFEMKPIARMGGMMAFMRLPGSTNHHDLGFLRVGADAPSAPERSPGLFHLAWQVEHIEDLETFRARLNAENALTGASDHGATKSLYGADPDGNEFEIMYLLPREAWGEFETSAITQRLDLPAEIERWSAPAR
jgi:catechol-2,3-dioxygenase